MKRILGETLAVLAVSIALAVTSNAVRGDGISLRADPRSLAIGTNVPLLELGKAHDAFEKGAVFVDARPRSAYLAGHVEGAISIPPENPDAAYREAHEFLPEDGQVVVYAAAKETGLAGTRATWLLTMGHRGASVLVDGWEAWEKSGYPTASGE